MSVSSVRGSAQRSLDSMLQRAGQVKVLEAGCGSASHLQFGPNAVVAGIDINKTALAQNRLLKERILGDIQTYDFPESEFDFVSCWNVLEHLSAPRQAIINLARSLKPGGLLLLALPNVLSFEGLLTKLTPHWFHIFVYRHVFGIAVAGRDGHGPFQTYLRFAIAPKRLERFIVDQGLEVVDSECYAMKFGMTRLKEYHPVFYWMYRMLARVSHILTFGVIHPQNSSYIVSVRKR